MKKLCIGVVLLLVCSGPAFANSALALREDGGPIVLVASGPSLTPLLFTGASPSGNFQVVNFGSGTVDFPAISVLASAATTVTLSTSGTHTLELFASSQDFSLAGPFVNVTSGAGGTYITGIGAVQYQAFADESNGLAGISGFTNGLQTATPDVGSQVTFVTGEITTVWDRGNTPLFSLTSGTAVTLTGAEASANFSNHVISTSNPIPEPASMLLLGTGLLALAAAGKRFRK